MTDTKKKADKKECIQFAEIVSLYAEYLESHDFQERRFGSIVIEECLKCKATRLSLDGSMFTV